MNALNGKLEGKNKNPMTRGQPHDKIGKINRLGGYLMSFGCDNKQTTNFGA